MKKVILQFELPEDKFDFEIASNAYNYYSCIRDLENLYRSMIKYDVTTHVREYLDEDVNKQYTDDQILELARAFRELLRASIEENKAFSVD